MEIWKDIKGCEGLFQASTEGRIKRVETAIVTKRGVKQVYKEKIYQPLPLLQWKIKNNRWLQMVL